MIKRFEIIREHYLMHTTSHRTAASIESGAFFELLVDGHRLLDLGINLGLICNIERITML